MDRKEKNTTEVEIIATKREKFPYRQPDVSSTLSVKMIVVAGVANLPMSTATLPLDVIKIRLQLDNQLVNSKDAKPKNYHGIIRGLRTLCLSEGATAMFKGWTASMMREMSYSAVRMGAYEPMKYQLGASDRHHTPLHLKVIAGACAATTAALVTTPVDLVKVQMQAQQSGPARRHRNTLSAFRNIYRAGGVSGLWTGWSPNVYRALFASTSQMASYDHTKHMLMNHGIFEEGFYVHVVASFVAGFCCALFSAPADNIKTRMMNQIGAPTGARYISPLDATWKTVQCEGFAGLYKGFLAFYVRITPHTIVTFVLLEKLRKYTKINPI